MPRANVKVDFKPSKIGFTVVFHRITEVNGNTNESIDAEKESQKFTDGFTEKFTDKFTENETQQQIIQMMFADPKISRAIMVTSFD